MLEIIFAVLQTLWKHHKSKDQTILHRSYTQKKSQLRKKIKKISTQQIFEKKIDQKSKMLIFEKLEFSIFGRKNVEKNFDPKKFENFLDSKKIYFFSELKKFLEYSFDAEMS